MIRIFLITTILFAGFSGYPQKIKYKDLFAQIEAKNYDAAEPLLRQFIFNPKNAEHPNANLQMGYAFERKLLAADILADTAYVYGWADSSHMYFAKAKQLITEKELKKNDKYYQAFYRRDLRTGDFGIKISDVQLDIENKLKTVKTRGDNIKGVNDNLTAANMAYNKAVDLTKELFDGYPDYTLFLIKSNENTKDILREIKREARRSKQAITSMRRSLSLIENPGFGPEFKYTDISNFKEPGVDRSDFYNGQFDLWTVGDWADDALDQIEKEIEPLRNDIIAYDRELTDYKSNLFAGGSNGKGALSFKENILDEINRYDDNSILKDIIDIKLQDINILKVYAPTLNSRAADKEDIDYQLLIADSLVGKYDELRVMVETLSAKDIDAEYDKYSFFVDSRMKGKSGLNDFIAEKQREVKEQTDYWNSQYDFWLETSRWALMEFGSLPLFKADTTVAYPNDSLNYLTLNMIRDDSLRIFPIGLEFGAKTQGYLASVAKNRDGEWYLNLDLGKMTPGDTTVSVQTKFAPSDPSQLTFYYYSPTSKKDNFVIFSVHKSGSQVWRNVMQLEKEPYEVRFSDTVSETIIYMDDPDSPTTEGTPQYFVIDRAGKMRN